MVKAIEVDVAARCWVMGAAAESRAVLAGLTVVVARDWVGAALSALQGVVVVLAAGDPRIMHRLASFTATRAWRRTSIHNKGDVGLRQRSQEPPMSRLEVEFVCDVKWCSHGPLANDKRSRMTGPFALMAQFATEAEPVDQPMHGHASGLACVDRDRRLIREKEVSQVDVAAAYPRGLLGHGVVGRGRNGLAH